MEAYVWKVLSLNSAYWFSLDFVEDREDLFVSYLFDYLSAIGYGLTYRFGQRTEPVGESKLFCFRDAGSAVRSAGPFDLVVRGRAGIGLSAFKARAALRITLRTATMFDEFWTNNRWLCGISDFNLFDYLDTNVVLVDWFEPDGWIWPSNVALALFLLRRFSKFYLTSYEGLEFMEVLNG